MLSQVLCKLGSENAHGCAQNTENVFSFAFLRVIPQDGDEFLNHIILLTVDETWVKAVDAHTFTKQAEEV
jgi:hypothetical protein